MKYTKSLKENSNFQLVLKRGKWYSGKCMTIHILSNFKDVNYIGIAVGKKVAKSVKRNRIKRLIREAYRLNEDMIKTGYSIIIIWKSKVPFEKATFNEIQSDLKSAFEKAGIQR